MDLENFTEIKFKIYNNNNKCETYSTKINRNENHKKKIIIINENNKKHLL